MRRKPQLAWHNTGTRIPSSKFLRWVLSYQETHPIDAGREDNCEGILKSILDASLENGTKFCLNMYDVRLRDTGFGQGCGMSWPTGLDITGTYLSVSLRSWACVKKRLKRSPVQRPDVIQALHAQAANKKWQECTQSVHSGLASDNSPAAYRVSHISSCGSA